MWEENTLRTFGIMIYKEISNYDKKFLLLHGDRDTINRANKLKHEVLTEDEVYE